MDPRQKVLTYDLDSIPCGPLARKNIDVQEEPYKSSYNRSYYYENAIYHPFVDETKPRKRIRSDLRAAYPEELESVYKASFLPKYSYDCSTIDYCRRSSTKSTLKNLHEEYVAHPPRPLKTPLSVAASSYVNEKITEPEKWPQKSPYEEFTIKLPSRCRENFYSSTPSDPGYTKHLEPYLSTSRLTHRTFTPDEQNGVARKDIATFYDIKGTPKLRGFGPRRLGPMSPYFHREYSLPYRVATKMSSIVPFFGNKSVTSTSFDFVPTNLMNPQDDVIYPAIFKPLEAAETYCTESCHMGTGWPVRAEIDVGKVPATR